MFQGKTKWVIRAIGALDAVGFVILGYMIFRTSHLVWRDKLGVGFARTGEGSHPHIVATAG